MNIQEARAERLNPTLVRDIENLTGFHGITGRWAVSFEPNFCQPLNGSFYESIILVSDEDGKEYYILPSNDGIDELYEIYDVDTGQLSDVLADRNILGMMRQLVALDRLQLYASLLSLQSRMNCSGSTMSLEVEGVFFTYDPRCKRYIMMVNRTPFADLTGFTVRDLLKSMNFTRQTAA